MDISSPPIGQDRGLLVHFLAIVRPREQKLGCALGCGEALSWAGCRHRSGSVMELASGDAISTWLDLDLQCTRSPTCQDVTTPQKPLLWPGSEIPAFQEESSFTGDTP